MKTKSTFQDYLILWGSQTVSSLGTAMTEYALVVWVYSQHGTASSVTLLTLCTFLPTILFRFIAGTLADRWDKKRIMLICDAFAACGTLLVLMLHSLHMLQIWHLYLINILLSFMNAFQVPASQVATSLLVPPKHYARAGGLQAFAGSAVSILAPALGSVLLAFGGLTLVLALDLFTFVVAFAALLFLIRIPKVKSGSKEHKPFWQECMAGLRFLKDRKPLLRVILFLTAINFLAKIGCDGQMAAFVLARANGSQQTLGLVQAAVSAGIMAGGLVMTWLKPHANRFAAVYLSSGLIFLLGDFTLSLTGSAPVWTAAAFLSYLTAAVMNVHLTVLMRENVPVELQGRVFSARDTLQNGCIPLGLALGGPLVDHVFEPFMRGSSPVRQWLVPVFGCDSGAGIALLFFLSSLAGAGLSLAAWWRSLRKPAEA
ncbi:MAG: MFS transporter [Clostridia bacterium]|nr:MFS transporter [Clostridia bacterium]